MDAGRHIRLYIESRGGVPSLTPEEKQVLGMLAARVRGKHREERPADETLSPVWRGIPHPLEPGKPGEARTAR